jgi:hypothetical protein
MISRGGGREQTMSGQTYLWTGGTDTFFSAPSNWYDVSTGAVASTTPGPNDTIIFPKGDFTIFSGLGGGTITVGNAILQPGANVDLDQFSAAPLPVPATPSYSFGSLTLEQNSTLDLGGVRADTVVLAQGATLNLTDTSGPDPNGVTIRELINQGGTINAGISPLAILGETVNTAQPEFVQVGSGFSVGFPGGTSGYYDIIPSESVIPFSNGLEIDFGNLAQGANLPLIDIGAVDPGAFSINAHIEAMYGSGFNIQALSGSTEFGSGIALLATAAIDTSKPGTHTEVVMTGGSTFTTSGGQTNTGAPQFLVLTDHVG